MYYDLFTEYEYDGEELHIVEWSAPRTYEDLLIEDKQLEDAELGMNYTLFCIRSSYE